MNKPEKTNEQIAIRTSRNTLIGNIALAAFKLIAGIVSHSAAMVSDAVHSLTDVVSTAVVIIGIKLGNKKSDDSHPYGHERLESAAAIVLSAILFATGAIIGYNGVRSALSVTIDHAEISIPGGLALIAAVFSIFVKEAMYWYTRNAAKKIGSGVLMADAWHQRADGLSSIGSFLGIFGARMGFPVLDPLAAVVICLFILRVAINTFRDAIRKMTDTACDDAVVDEIRTVALAQYDVLGVDNIMTRLFGERIYVDIEIGVDSRKTLTEAHDVAENVHNAIEKSFDKVKHCMVHVNPRDVSEE